MGAGLRISVITFLLVLSFNLAFPQPPSDYCFQTPWGPQTACLSIEILHNTPSLDSVTVVLRHIDGNCFGLSTIDSTRLSQDTFYILATWYWAGTCICPEGGPGHPHYFPLGSLTGNSLTVVVDIRIDGCEGNKAQTSYLKKFALSIPTLSEFGLIIFALLLAMAIFWYLSKHKA